MRIFDLKVTFTGRTKAERDELVRQAKVKLFADVRAQGVEPVPDTFRVKWHDPTCRNGHASVNVVELVKP